jgi:hydroxyacylglutathione hydrolase
VDVVDSGNGVVIGRVSVGPLETNAYVIGCTRTRSALLVDPGDQSDVLLRHLAPWTVTAIVLTHAHWDHVQAVNQLRTALDVPVLAHPAELPVWQAELQHLSKHGQWDWALAAPRAPVGGRPPEPGWDGVLDAHLHEGDVLQVGNVQVSVLATPGHSTGSVSLAVTDAVLTGDTLFPGGPGLTGWPFSDFPTIMQSVERLLALEASTRLHPGHGPSTLVARERPHVDQWRLRGW